MKNVFDGSLHRKLVTRSSRIIDETFKCSRLYKASMQSQSKCQRNIYNCEKGKVKEESPKTKSHFIDINLKGGCLLS